MMRYIKLGLLLMLVVSLCSCGNSTVSNSDGSNGTEIEMQETAKETQTFSVGIISTNDDGTVDFEILYDSDDYTDNEKYIMGLWEKALENKRNFKIGNGITASSVYIRGKNHFNITIKISDLGMSTDELLESELYREIVEFELTTTSDILLETRSKGIVIADGEIGVYYSDPEYSGEYSSIAFDYILSEGKVSYAKNKYIENASLEKFVEIFGIEFDSRDLSFEADNTNTEAGYEACPFSEEAVQNACPRADWYDNGVFSSYFEEAFDENDTWSYVATTDGYIMPNPYDYEGFDIYQVSKNSEYELYFSPNSPYAPAPIIYKYDPIYHQMMMVYRDGEIIE